jgi:hypothetical protein
VEGISHIDTYGQIDCSTGEKLIAGLRAAIRNSHFKNVENYEPLLGWLHWVSIFS